MKKVFVMALGLFMLVGCKKETVVNPAKERPAVRVTSAVRGDISEILTLTGNIEGINTAEVFPKISGRIMELPVNKGELVKSGHTLAVLEHSAMTTQVKQFEAALEVANLQLKQLEINLTNLEKERERITNLAEAGAVSQQRKDEIETRYAAMKEQREQAKAQIKQTEAMLEFARIQEKEATLISPIDGFVAQRYLEKGDMATPTRPAFEIVQMDTVKVIAAVPEQYIRKVTTETPVKVEIYPDNDLRIKRIAPTLDPKTRSAEIEIHIENTDYKLKPGMFTRLDLILATHRDVFILPKDYLIAEAGQYFILLVKDGKINKQSIKTGIESQGMIEILEGLNEGDKVVSTVGAHLKDGMEVEIVK